ncbi:MAG TPA: DUF3592 domain-containing protein [Pyrinomonadaceae bacterium]|nr:DUF3592 domain-containing protein [Pyrinomonadaceae bacterium]
MSEKFVLPLVFSGIGIVMLLIAVVAWVRLRRFVAESLRAEGTVVRLEERKDADGDMVYAPVVRFTPRGGREREFRDPIWSRPAGYSVGQRVDVFYHHREYKRARLASPFRLYYVPGLLGFGGMVFTLIGIAVFFLA